MWRQSPSTDRMAAYNNVLCRMIALSPQEAPRDPGETATPSTEDGAASQECEMHTALRDYFAGIALQGYITSCPCTSSANRAKWSYAAADAMLKEREGSNE